MTGKEYLLTVLTEECGEVIQAATKLIRFGPEASDPTNPRALSNEHQLLVEYHQLCAVMELLFEDGILSDLSVEDAENVVREKKAKVRKYADRSRELGIISDGAEQNAREVVEEKKQGSFREVVGDILTPVTDGRETIVCHQVNCKGVMGAGLAKQIRQKFPNVYQAYYGLCCGVEPRKLLGTIQIVDPEPNVGFRIANLFGQLGFGRDRPYTDYDALRLALWHLSREHPGAVIRIPYGLGCGLAGGNWSTVRDIIGETLGEREVEIWRLPE